MRCTAFLAMFLLGGTGFAAAPTPSGPAQPTRIPLDLAGIGALSQAVDAGSFEVALENRLPQARYEVVIKRELIPVAAIALAGIGSINGVVKAERAGGNCEPLDTATAALNGATSESQVPARRAVVDALVTAATCQDPVAQAEAKAAVAGTRQALPVLEIRPSERVTYTITRAVPEAQPQTWTLVLETEPRGEWATSYGMSFVPDRDRRFNSEAIGAGKFKIVEEQNEWALRDPIPSVYFSWVSSKQKRGNGGLSPTAGFGVGGTAPSVFGGVSYTFNQNLSFIAGVSVTGQRRLNGRYQPNQEVSENLSEEQLHRVVYRPTPVVAIAIRFDGNPFKKDETPTPPAVPAAAAAPAAPSKPDPKSDSSLDAPPSNNPPQAEASRDSDIKLRFDSRGNLRDPAVAAALQQRARTATDVFIISHGWWNDESAADCFYRRMVGGIDRSKPEYLTEDRFKPLFVTVYWPSALFPMEPSDCVTGGRTESSAAGGFSAERVQRWAAVAFPDAAALPAFAADTTRIAALLERERTGALADAESDELAVILVRWRSASGASGAAGEGSEPEAFTGTGPQIAQRWRNRPDARGELAIPGLSNPKKWLNFGNAFTFWTMKERAGLIGSRGLYEIVKALQPLRQNNVRIHLIGHSFGGKLVTASLTGTGGAMNRADSLIILQGAFSQFAFATRDEIRAAGVTVDQGGLYRDVIASGLVAGPIVATYSSADVPNQVLYPAGVALMNDVTEATRAPRFGSLGAQGIRGLRASTLNLSLQTIDTLGEPLPRAISVDGSNVILGHSDLVKPQLFKLIWDVVEHGR